MKKFFATKEWGTAVALWVMAVGAYAQGVVPGVGGDKVADGASRFGGGYARLIVGDESYYIDTTGRRAFDVAYMYWAWLGDADDEKFYLKELASNPELLSNTVITVKKNNKTGVLTPGGAWVLAPEYDTIDLRYREFWTVRKNGQVSFYGRSGFLIPFYDDAGYLDGRFFRIKKGNRWGVYDAVEKRLVVPARYSDIDFCRDCRTAARYVYASDGGKWGVVSLTGAVLVPFSYGHRPDKIRNDDWILSFSRGGRNVAVHIPSRTEVFEDNYNGMSVASNGLLVVREGDKYGAFGPGGKTVLPFTCEALTEPGRQGNDSYTGTYLLATIGGKTGVVNENGAWVLKPNYETVSVYGHQFVVKTKGLTGLADRGGKSLLAPAYTAIKPLIESAGGEAASGIFKVWQKDLCGLYFAQSDKLVSPAFDDVEMGALADGAVLVIQAVFKKTWRYFNVQGDTLTREDVMAQIAARTNDVPPPPPPPLARTEQPNIFNLGEYHLLEENGKFGLKARDGRVLLPAKFDDIAINRRHAPREVVFPLLCKEGDTWCYYTREGRRLNITASRVIGFYKN